MFSKSLNNILSQTVKNMHTEKQILCNVIFKNKELFSPGKILAGEKESCFLSWQHANMGLVGGIEVCSLHK